MQNPGRRAFTTHFSRTLFGFLLTRALCRGDALAGSLKAEAHSWLREMQRLSHELAAGTLKQVEWQQGIEQCLAHIDLGELLAAIDYERLSRTITLVDNHESVEEVIFSKSHRLPGELSFSPYFYALRKGRAIVPHGHHNMATMHMVLRGEARARHFERVRDEPEHMTIRMTTDKIAGPGDLSTISDDRENVHWFVALSEPVFLFNIGVYGIRAGESHRGRDYIDPAGEKLADGSIRARRLNPQEAFRLYGSGQELSCSARQQVATSKGWLANLDERQCCATIGQSANLQFVEPFSKSVEELALRVGLSLVLQGFLECLRRVFQNTCMNRLTELVGEKCHERSAAVIWIGDRESL